MKRKSSLLIMLLLGIAVFLGCDKVPKKIYFAGVKFERQTKVGMGSMKKISLFLPTGEHDILAPKRFLQITETTFKHFNQKGLQSNINRFISFFGKYGLVKINNDYHTLCLRFKKKDIIYLMHIFVYTKNNTVLHLLQHATKLKKEDLHTDIKELCADSEVNIIELKRIAHKIF